MEEQVLKDMMPKLVKKSGYNYSWTNCGDRLHAPMGNDINIQVREGIVESLRLLEMPYASAIHTTAFNAIVNRSAAIPDDLHDEFNKEVHETVINYIKGKEKLQ